jgi:hypothetical protein
MDICCNGKSIEDEVYLIPYDLDPDGLKILRDAGFEWDPISLAFQKRAAGHSRKFNATIEYRFLREQKLVMNGGMDKREREGQLQRLRILLQSID